MLKKIDKLSLASRGLKYKLRISACLMAVLPLLVLGYLVSNYILPHIGFQNIDVYVSIIVSVFIAVIGFLVVKEIFDRVVTVSAEARLIAAGDLEHKINIGRPDEVGDLSDALNTLTRRIRSNMEELKSYGEKTSEINFSIQKRVIVLSSLLQLSSLISQDAKLEDILRLAVEKARLLVASDTAYLLFREDAQKGFSVKLADGINSERLLAMNIEPKEGLFSRFIEPGKPFIVDKENVLPRELAAEFAAKFKLKNTIALPVYLKGKVSAVLGIGNSAESFAYKKEDIELMDIFAKQIAIAIENDLLSRRLEKLDVKDALTGSYNEAFIRNRLEEEIKRAINCQRPCAFVMADVDNFRKYRETFGSLQAESVLKKIASLIKDSISEIDRVGRFSDNEFGIILPEKNKRKAQETAEQIRKRIEFAFSEETDAARRITVSAGASENPFDGINAEELIARARELMAIAKKQGKNRVVAFTEPAACK